MKVSGFTFIRNAIKFDYPVVEAIRSILPVCDDFFVAVGNSDDNTLDIVQNIDKQKIKILKTIWDDSPEMKKGGKVFASETDKAFKSIPALIPAIFRESSSSPTEWPFVHRPTAAGRNREYRYK